MMQIENSVHNDGRFDDYMGQVEAKAYPTQDDVKETRRLLKDFGLWNIEIPQFVNKSGLVRWRSAIIKQRLAGLC